MKNAPFGLQTQTLIEKSLEPYSTLAHFLIARLISMAKVSENELDSVRRRVASVSNHLAPVPFSNYVSIGLSNTSMNDSYHRIHGEVSTEQVVWRNTHDGSEQFTDIIYDKAVGEGIAKVLLLLMLDGNSA